MAQRRLRAPRLAADHERYTAEFARTFLEFPRCVVPKHDVEHVTVRDEIFDDWNIILIACNQRDFINTSSIWTY